MNHIKLSFGGKATDPNAFLVVGGILLCLGGVLSSAILLEGLTSATLSNQPFDPGQIYNITNVWTIHLKFEPDQWNKLEPKDAGIPFARGTPESSTPRRTLAPVIMSQADSNRDARISQEEFLQLAKNWFRSWDTNASGKLNEVQVRTGLGSIRNPAGEGLAGMLLAPEGKRNGVGAALGFDLEYVHADLEFDGRLFKDVGARYKGNGTFMESRNSFKRSFKIQLNRYNKGQSLDGVTTLNLQNNVTDPTMMNEVLAYRLYRDAGVPAPRTAYAKVFVTVLGRYDRKYFGLYSMTEAVDKKFAERRFGTKKGAIFKPVTPSLFTDLGADWAAYNQVYDPKSPLYEEQKRAVIELSRLVTYSDDATFTARIGEFIDLPEFARFMAVMVYLSDLDGILGPGQNLYLHLHPKTQQFQFIPWDQDHSWGQFDRASQEQRDRLSIHRPWLGGNFFLERMFKVDAFKRLYLDSLNQFSKTIFRPERFAKQVDEIAAV
ncbi:MAG: CotH kinase family protein, partial [Verrucomicrobiae bacterium]|nr:CotH kinase family protein [Verrucomicrobiae bacterium]